MKKALSQDSTSNAFFYSASRFTSMLEVSNYGTLVATPPDCGYDHALPGVAAN
jgi:hypothetical protein